MADVKNTWNARVSVSPHLHEGSSTARIMISVIVCLLPAGIWGVLIFGLYSLYVILASVATVAPCSSVQSWRLPTRKSLPAWGSPWSFSWVA